MAETRLMYCQNRKAAALRLGLSERTLDPSQVQAFYHFHDETGQVDISLMRKFVAHRQFIQLLVAA